MRDWVLSSRKGLVALLLLFVPAVAYAPPVEGGGDPTTVASSAAPVALPANLATAGIVNSEGPIVVPNLKISNFGVVDGMIFRGEQPRADEYAALAQLGVTTIVDLRLEARPDSRELAEAAGLRYVNIPIDDHKQPSDEDVATFLKLIDEPQQGRVYVHCAGGRHRTGSMIAVYRMVRDGWTIDQAYDEMLKYDFYTRNGHKGFKTFVFDYYERMKADPTSVPVAYVPPAALVQPSHEAPLIPEPPLAPGAPR